jgi:hypothetical protein
VKYSFKLPVTILLLLVCLCIKAQKPDTIQTTSKNNVFGYAMGFIKKKNKDTIPNRQQVLTTKSEAAFKTYEGKIIRNIVVNRFKFEKTFTDTSQTINYFGTRLLNTFHNNTKDWVIRNNLFIKENTPVTSYLIADNERHLRSLDFIQDARIIVQPKTGSPDSVDVYVITKDLFSINGVINQASTGKFRGSIEDANLFGMGQSLQASILIEKDREPATGIGLMYTKYNLAHSFINVSAGYSTINQDLFNRTRDEHAITFSLQRDLYSQFSHFAGGLLLGDFKTVNNYGKPDTSFYDYHYKLFDMWIGYNLGVKKYVSNRNRTKKFVSLRYLNANFIQTPQQAIDKLIFRFNDKQAILGQFTLFKQEFYKTNYLYGFGNTEDVPYGYNIAFTGGWYKQSYLSRAYAGIDANKYRVYRKGDIVQYFVRAGGFYNQSRFEDIGVLAGFSAFSRALLFNDFKMRQYLRFSYGRLFNRTGLEPLSINSPFGIRYFRTDSVLSEQRISLHSETITFANFKVFGFKFSPFAFGDVAAIIPEKDLRYQNNWYYGIGGGIRTRNENLVFKTVEFRFVYFPRTAYGIPHFQGRLTINIQFRYNTNYVHKPEIVQLNSDLDNNIF